MALLYFLSFSWVDMDTSVTASISRITGLPLLTDWTTWSRLDVRYAATLHFIRHVALPYLDGPSRTTHAKAITATLLHMQLGPVSVSLPDEIRYSLCEIWNRTVRIAPDRDEHRVALHILACLHPFYSQSHLHVFATASEQSQGAETYDELIALEQSDFLPCAAASHRRPPSRAPFVTAPPSDPAIPVTPTTPGTNKTLVPGASFTSLPTVDLSFPVDSPVRSNHFTLPVAVSTSQQNILPPSNPVDTDNLTK
ncbi:hypothetical protein BC834DRAFT_897700 [Gloeopeniophorella convolvens]|nr:hypothetical protein BC834DRAFT_897700 [Gloeopeniophorella convolvens]